MREISLIQKIQITITIIACCLIFYAVGIVTNFFANPIFSMFFIVSQETAYSIVTYAAVIVAVALIIITSSIILIQKRKSTILKMTQDEANHGKNIKLTPSINDQKITKYLESSSAEKPIMQLTKQSRTQMTAQSNAYGVAMSSQGAMSEGKIICAICKEKFDVPLYQIDTSPSRVDIVRLCPYCRQSLDSQPENTIDDWWVRTFNTSTVQ